MDCERRREDVIGLNSMVDGAAAQAFRRAMGEPEAVTRKKSKKGSSAPGSGRSKSGSSGAQHGATSARARAHQARMRAADPLGIKAVAGGALRLYEAAMQKAREQTGLSDSQLGAVLAGASLLRSLRAFYHRWTRVKRIKSGRDWGREMQRAEKAGKPLLILFDLQPGAVAFQVPDPSGGAPVVPEAKRVEQEEVATERVDASVVVEEVAEGLLEDGHIADDSSGDEDAAEGTRTKAMTAGEHSGPVLEDVSGEEPRERIRGAGVMFDSEEEGEGEEEGQGYVEEIVRRDDPVPHMGYTGGFGAMEGEGEEEVVEVRKPQVQLRPAEAAELRKAFTRMGRRDMSVLFCVLDVGELTGAVLAKACGVEKFPQVACVESADVKAIHEGRTPKSLERFAREMGGGGKRVAKKKNPMQGGLGGFKESSNAPAAFGSH